MQEPSLEILEFKTMYGPFRDALIKCFKASHSLPQVHGHKVCTKTLQAQYGLQTVHRADRLLPVLREAVHAIEGQDFAFCTFG